MSKEDLLRQVSLTARVSNALNVRDVDRDTTNSSSTHPSSTGSPSLATAETVATGS